MNHALVILLRVSCLVLCVAVPAAAETVYLTNQFKAGLHEEKSLDSPITKLISSGTALEVIKREESLSFVREPNGATGWIDNSYLSAELPVASEQLRQAMERGDVLERRLADAQQEIARLSTSTSGPAGLTDKLDNEVLKKQQAELEQQLKQERLRAGELQIQLAELKKRLGVSSDNASLYQRIEELEAENKKLEVALGGDSRSGESPAPENPGTSTAASGVSVRLQNLVTGLALAIIGGFLGGVFLMDYLNRRRHGGFRV